jgi:hypothetical protein
VLLAQRNHLQDSNSSNHTTLYTSGLQAEQMASQHRAGIAAAHGSLCKPRTALAWHARQ